VEPSLSLKVLVVEDDGAIREAISDALSSEGYLVTAVESAEEGLRELEAGGQHLVVTDYMLPGQHGTWLVREAQQRGLLAQGQALLITAHPNPERVPGLKVLRKPVDLHEFLLEVYVALGPARDAELARARRELVEALPPAPAPAGRRAEFVLYVSAASPASLKALRNMQRLLVEHDASQVRFTVCDLSREASLSADEDRIVFTPTLVKRYPEPKTWVLGDLENLEMVADLLRHAGVDRKR
jgi:CheY-like chemotaxis protein